ncbi:MAG TPA: ArsC/Spx/MgsR family protein [Bacteroidia bacterium]|jgi:arsenate reductase|nr:ArsC/Spx/MgsR family protein [Bacteroidia bacterium]
MKKIYYLSSCSTCARIIKELQLEKKGFKFQDIKTEKITAAQLAEMKDKTGSYEALFSRVALKYKSLDPKPSTENEYKKLILEEYTFLKRPVILIGKEVFVGNSPKNVAAAKAAL